MSLLPCCMAWSRGTGTMLWSRSTLLAKAAPLACKTHAASRTSHVLPCHPVLLHLAQSFSVSASQPKAGTSALKALPTSQDVSDTESSVARGTRYEHLCGAVLAHMFGMELERTGGAGDRGIDLRGWWQPPPPPPFPPSISASIATKQRRIRIVAQCKCQDEGGKKMGPVLVREMEGVVFRASTPASAATQQSRQSDGGDQEEITAGIIMSSSGFSKQALLQVRSSNVPLAAIHVLAQPSACTADGENAAALAARCVSVVWNDRFGSPTHGLLEGGMEVRWVRSYSPRQNAVEGSMGRPVIYRAGKPLSLTT